MGICTKNRIHIVFPNNIVNRKEFRILQFLKILVSLESLLTYLCHKLSLREAIVHDSLYMKVLPNE